MQLATLPLLSRSVACVFRILLSIYNTLQEVDFGLAPDVGSLAFLPKITGNDSLVRELTYTARPFSAIEAEKLGLLSKVVQGGRDEVVREALQIAKLIASKSPVAVASSKHLISHSRDHSVAENLSYTSVWNAAALMTKVAFSFLFLIFACSTTSAGHPRSHFSQSGPELCTLGASDQIIETLISIMGRHNFFFPLLVNKCIPFHQILPMKNSNQQKLLSVVPFCARWTGKNSLSNGLSLILPRSRSLSFYLRSPSLSIRVRQAGPSFQSSRSNNHPSSSCQYLCLLPDYGDLYVATRAQCRLVVHIGFTRLFG